MPATSVTKLFAGQTGDWSQDQRSYVEIYSVDVSLPTDGQITAINAVKVEYGLTIGLSYYTNNFELDPEAKLKNLSAGRVDGTRLRWTVQASYETPPKNDKADESNEPQPDQNGNLTDDPDQWRERVDWSAQTFARPVTDAKLLSDKIPKLRSINTQGPVIVASGEVVDPPPEIDDHDVSIRLTRFSRNFPSEQAAKYKNAVNIDAFEIRKPGLTLSISKYEARMLPITGSLNYHTAKNGQVIPYWQINYEVLIRWVGKVFPGWRYAQLNYGYHRRALVGDLSGRSGSGITTSEYNAQEAAGLPALKRITDADGGPVGPLLLNYDGQPLKKGEDALYLMYSIYPEENFSSLPIWT